MTTLRELCSAAGDALHIPGVERYAAPLVRESLLPRSREEVGARDTAILLLAVAAAACPGDAVEVVERLVHLPLILLKRHLYNENSFPEENWVHGRIPDSPLTIVEAVEHEIACAAGDISVRAIEIAEGGGHAKIYGIARHEGENYIIHVIYADPVVDWTAGLYRFVRVDQCAFRAMGSILAGHSGQPVTHEIPMQSLQTH